MSVVLLAASFLRRAQADSPEQMTLLGTLAEWKYPGSNLPGGATMSDGGNAQEQSVKCKAVLTTPDPIEKVIAYYTEKFGTGESPDRQAGKAEVKKGEARSVSVQDDSQDRPVMLRVFVVNKADTSTALVISRAQGENETHIAWSHYRRFVGKPTLQAP
jgi:hypothetical protein